MANFFNRITNFTNRLRAQDASPTNEFNLPAARLANGARSPPMLHINGIHRQTPDDQKKDDLDSPVVITSGKFSPPPYLFEGLRDPFADQWCSSDTSKEEATSLNSLGIKELSKASTLERQGTSKRRISDDDFEDELLNEPWPPPPNVSSSEPPKQKPPLAPKPPVPPKPPISTPYAVPIVTAGTSTLKRKAQYSQYAKPSIHSNNSEASENMGPLGNGIENHRNTLIENAAMLQESMLSEIDKTYKEISEQSDSIEMTMKSPPQHSPPPAPTIPSASLSQSVPQNSSSEPLPPLPPPDLPISPLSSSPTTPLQSPPSSTQLSPPSSPSDSPPSSSPNSPPHFLLGWR